MFKIQLQLVVWQTENKRMPNVFCSFVIILIPGFILNSKGTVRAKNKGCIYIIILSTCMSDIE